MWDLTRPGQKQRLLNLVVQQGKDEKDLELARSRIRGENVGVVSYNWARFYVREWGRPGEADSLFD